MKIYLKATIIVYVLIGNSFSKTIYSKKNAIDENSINLNNFMNLLHNAQIDLKWIRDTNQLHRGKKFVTTWLATPDLKYISLGDTLKSGGDKWYKQFRDNEFKLEQPDDPGTTAIKPDENIANNKLIDPQNLQDQSDTTKNDLSHEANYKLSKYEQEKEEKIRVDKENAIKVMRLPATDLALNKRKINPDQEILLKIRSRMADKYETFVERHLDPANFSDSQEYDNYLKTHRAIPNYNLFKRETPQTDHEFTNRKLLAYDYEEYNGDDEASNYFDVDQKNYEKYRVERQKRQKKDSQETTETMINDMVTGILPNILVKAIFTLAQKNNNFVNVIVPNVKISSFVEIKKSDIKAENAKSKDNLSKKADDMINQIVKGISLLVDNQVKGRSCLQIDANLKQFLTKLMTVRKNSKILSGKFEFPVFSKQPEQNLPIDDEIDSNRFTRSLPNNIDSGLINDKYSIITNLQNSFSKLGTSDQIRYNMMKEFIDKHLSLLDELSELSHRNIQTGEQYDEQHRPVKRDAFIDSPDEEFNPDLNTIEIKQPFNDQMTERFIKLSKMVEFMRQNSLLDATDYDLIGNDFIL